MPLLAVTLKHPQKMSEVCAHARNYNDNISFLFFLLSYFARLKIMKPVIYHIATFELHHFINKPEFSSAFQARSLVYIQNRQG